MGAKKKKKKKNRARQGVGKNHPCLRRQGVKKISTLTPNFLPPSWKSNDNFIHTIIGFKGIFSDFHNIFLCMNKKI